MKKLVLFFFCMLGLTYTAIAQTQTDSVAQTGLNFLRKHHKIPMGIFLTSNNISTFRSASTTSVRLDSIVDYSDKDTTKEAYTYNSNGGVATATYYIWNGKWVKEEQDTYTYNADKFVSSLLIQYLDTATSKTDSKYKLDYTYNSSGKMISQIAYYAEDTTGVTWSPSSKNQYTYNSKNQILSDTSFYYSGSWVSSMKYAYTYNADNKLASMYTYSLNGSLSNLLAKIEYTYLNSKIDSVLSYNASGSSWVKTSDGKYSYDSYGNPITGFGNSYSSGTLYISSKTEYTYNTSYSLSNINLPDEYKSVFDKTADLNYNNMLTKSVTYYKSPTTAWYQGDSTLYYYSNISSGVFNSKSSNLKVTTVNGKAFISGLPQGETLAVYNLQGIAIYNQKATAETVSVNLPAHGVYVVKLGNESVKVVY